jgi:hypothetical protein
MRKWFFLLIFVCGVPQDASAETYNIDLSNVGMTFEYTGPCYCQEVQLYNSPIYTFEAGDTVNFGSVTINPILTFNHSINPEPPTPNVYLESQVSFITAPFLPQSDPGFTPIFCTTVGVDCAQPETVDLTYTFDAATTFQLVWANGDYYPVTEAVPEPATWAMLLIGFAGIGFAGYCKCRHQPSLSEPKDLHGQTVIIGRWPRRQRRLL